MSLDVPVQPPQGHRVVPRQLWWALIAVALLTAGALGFAGGVVQWWEPCFGAGFDSTECVTRQSVPSDLSGFDVLPGDQRPAAIMLASSTLVVGLLWFSLLLIGGKSVLVRVVACLGGAYTIARVLPDLLWYTPGSVLFHDDQILTLLNELGLIIVPGLIVALLPAASMWERDEMGRLGLLVLGLAAAASPISPFVEYSFWMMIYASEGTPQPGFGWLQSAMYTVCGVGILYLTLRRKAVQLAP